MKHASADSLKPLEELLADVRKLPGVRERKPGTFYCGSAAFLHFHEDPAGLFADIKLNKRTFSRFPVNNQRERSALLAVAKEALSESSKVAGGSSSV